MDLLGLFLHGAPLAILAVCIVWFVKFINSQQKGERSILKWRGMGPTRKVFLGVVSVWICLNLYLAIANELDLLNIAALPLSRIYSLAFPADLWGTTATIVILAVLFQLRFPRRSVVA